VGEERRLGEAKGMEQGPPKGAFTFKSLYCVLIGAVEFDSPDFGARYWIPVLMDDGARYGRGNWPLDWANPYSK
jgi:hypothetical protein